MSNKMTIAIYTLTSELHNEQAVSAVTKEFLNGLNVEYVLKGNDYADYGSHALNLIYVRTGGTEGIFKQLLPDLQIKSGQPIYLLTSGKSNSLAASMEILSYLQQKDLKGEIIHGNADYISQKIKTLALVGEAKRQLKGSRLGVIGQPSDWLISSNANIDVVSRKLGMDIVNIPMKDLMDAISTVPLEEIKEPAVSDAINKNLPGAHQIYQALKIVVERHQLQGFTLRCFDLLTSVRNTGCLALARLNAEGLVAGCEGDVPAMLSMKMVQALLGVSGFQANPSSINPETGEIVFAHCTIPLNMVERYEYDTHFESGIGVGIRGYMKKGPVTIFKVAGDLSRYFVAEAELVENQAKPDLCRTQQVIRLSDPAQASYFLTHPIGNHHIIIPGHHKDLIETMFRLL